MPAYNFQFQFVEKILNGEKPHTIRRRRKHPTKVGDRIMMFTGMRTKDCRQFAEATCVKIVPVRIQPFERGIQIYDPESQHPDNVNGWRLLIGWEEMTLAHNDGFEKRTEFYKFFERYKSDFLGDFEILIWDPKKVKAV